MPSEFRRFTRAHAGVLALLSLVAAGCDKVPLLAPTNSSISISASTNVLPTGGSTEISAMVIESSGTPVQNGTTVRFTTTLGSISPVEAQTKNGVAVATFSAGDVSGVAEIRATSGGAGGGGTAAPPAAGGAPGANAGASSTNVIQISIGAAAADSVVLTANPSSVSPFGGTVDVAATVLGASGRPLTGVLVIFTSDNGTLSSTSGITDQSGQARITLTTNVTTKVHARAGAKDSNDVTVTARTAPTVTLSCTSISSGSNCALAAVNELVTFTVASGTGGSLIRSATLDFGDGSSVTLGTISGSTSVGHRYAAQGVYTARLTATDLNGETVTVSQIVNVETSTVPIASLQLTSLGGKGVRATVTASGGTVQSYDFSFGADGVPSTLTTTSVQADTTYQTSGLKTVTVTVRFTSGAIVPTSAQITVP